MATRKRRKDYEKVLDKRLEKEVVGAIEELSVIDPELANEDPSLVLDEASSRFPDFDKYHTQKYQALKDKMVDSYMLPRMVNSRKTLTNQDRIDVFNYLKNNMLEKENQASKNRQLKILINKNHSESSREKEAKNERIDNFKTNKFINNLKYEDNGILSNVHPLGYNKPGSIKDFWLGLNGYYSNKNNLIRVNTNLSRGKDFSKTLNHELIHAFMHANGNQQKQEKELQPLQLYIKNLEDFGSKYPMIAKGKEYEDTLFSLNDYLNTKISHGGKFYKQGKEYGLLNRELQAVARDNDESEGKAFQMLDYFVKNNTVGDIKSKFAFRNAIKNPNWKINTNYIRRNLNMANYIIDKRNVHLEWKKNRSSNRQSVLNYGRKLVEDQNTYSHQVKMFRDEDYNNRPKGHKYLPGVEGKKETSFFRLKDKWLI